MKIIHAYRRAPIMTAAFGLTSIASVLCTAAVLKIALQGGQVGDQFSQMVWIVFFGLGLWVVSGQIYDRMMHQPKAEKQAEQPRAVEQGRSLDELLDILGVEDTENEMENKEMISTTDLAASALISPQDMKTRAATIRRSTGIIKTEIDAAKWTELSAREVEILTKAQELLNILASRYAGAGEQQRKGLDAREVRKRAVMTAIQGTFGSLLGDDLLCLIWSVTRAGFKRYVLDGVVSDLDDPLDTIAFRCAQGVENEAAALAKACEMWTRFEAEKGRWLVEARSAAEKIQAEMV